MNQYWAMVVVRVLKKKTKKLKEDKSIEVKVNVPLTGVSLTSLLLAGLLVLVGYSGYLGVKSIWKFTHPRFEINVDSFKALAYAAKNTTIPPLPTPTFSGKNIPDDLEKAEFLEFLKPFKSEFSTKYRNSSLLRIPDNALLAMGWSFCQAKQKSIDSTGKYSVDEIVSEYQSKFVLKYVNVPGLDEYLAGVGQTALNHLCKDN